MSIFDFASMYGDGKEKASQAVELSQAILRGADYFNELPDTPCVGLLLPNNREYLADINVTLFVNSNRVAGINPTQRLHIREVEGIYSRIVKYFDYEPEWLKDIYIFGIDEPVFQLQPSEMISSQLLRGTAGCKLNWHNGFGFATAGHVAPNVGMDINDGAGVVGKVIWANNPNGHGKSIEADFSIVEMANGAIYPNNIGSYSQAKPYDDVIVKSALNNTRQCSSKIAGYSYFFHMPQQNATIGNCYLTFGQITFPGDSGAMATLNNGNIIGHVVGASPHIMSLIQDVSYQIDCAKSKIPSLTM